MGRKFALPQMQGLYCDEENRICLCREYNSNLLYTLGDSGFDSLQDQENFIFSKERPDRLLVNASQVFNPRHLGGRHVNLSHFILCQA
jgi:hypothetical protein